jgi:hypothetical protein
METTKRQYKLFTAAIKRLLIKYGLTSWEVAFEHEYIDQRTISTTVPELSSRIVVFTLNTKFLSPDLTDKELRETAKHEVLELLFHKLEDMVCKSKAEEAREEVHAIIQTLLNVRS